MRDSQHAIEALIERERKRGIVPERHACWPASPRAARSRCRPACATRAPLAGVMALSTYLPLPDKLENERSKANQNVPILMAHGIEDPDRAAQARAGLRAHAC